MEMSSGCMRGRTYPWRCLLKPQPFKFVIERNPKFGIIEPKEIIFSFLNLSRAIVEVEDPPLEDCHRYKEDVVALNLG
jgi:hypothetical protein